VIESSPEAVHQLAAGLWRSAREHRWTRSARLSFRWRPESDEVGAQLRQHLGEQLDPVPVLDAGADAAPRDVGASVVLTAPTLSSVEAQIRWAFEAGRRFKAELLAVGIGEPRRVE
jgi:hypothetical protein